MIVASTSTTSTTTTTTGVPLQIIGPSEIIKQCQQPVAIGTILSTFGVGIVTSIAYAVFMAKMSVKPPARPIRRQR